MRRPLASVLFIALAATACGDATGEGTTPTLPPTLDEATLSESWACGRGFHLSDEEQTVALMLDLTDTTYEEPVPASATLPDGRWDARVIVGEDLFSNWCDDVIEASDPEPRIDETWPVVGGTITMADEVSEVGACDRPATAHLAGLVVERPDGTRVTIPDRDVSNTCWGGAAG